MAIEGKRFGDAFALHQGERGRIYVAPLLVGVGFEDRPRVRLDGIVNADQLNRIAGMEVLAPLDRLFPGQSSPAARCMSRRRRSWT